MSGEPGIQKNVSIQKKLAFKKNGHLKNEPPTLRIMIKKIIMRIMITMMIMTRMILMIQIQRAGKASAVCSNSNSTRNLIAPLLSQRISEKLT